jgi:hypothetical protein
MLPTVTTTTTMKCAKPRMLGVDQNRRVVYQRKGASNSRPWSLLVLLLISTLVMVYTKYSSLSQKREYNHPEDLLRKRYLNTAPLPPIDSLEKTGSWNLTQDVYDTAIKHPNARIISFDNPRLILFPSFMTHEETDHLIDLAKKDLKRSHVVADSKDAEVSNVRTSYGAWPKRDNFMQMIEDRIHRLVGIPNEFGEGMYVLNYKQGQEYKAHNDNCKGGRGSEVTKSCEDFLKRAGGPECGPGHGGVSCGDRIATFIIVLDPAEEGGHTAFPRADITNKNTAGEKLRVFQENAPWYCTEEYQHKVLQVAPKKGDAALFWDYKPLPPGKHVSPEDGMAEEVDGSQHSGCPVVKGEKWIVTRWIRSSTFN